MSLTRTQEHRFELLARLTNLPADRDRIARKAAIFGLVIDGWTKSDADDITGRIALAVKTELDLDDAYRVAERPSARSCSLFMFRRKRSIQNASGTYQKVLGDV